MDKPLNEFIENTSQTDINRTTICLHVFIKICTMTGHTIPVTIPVISNANYSERVICDQMYICGLRKASTVSYTTSPGSKYVGRFGQPLLSRVIAKVKLDDILRIQNVTSILK
ncbi:hypothetical protein CDAR_548661 [Caerostris darwini]|uniref:Uncharacterized protein n=1 Tax=Caerostris darwini TaxID=1538125 RepID=A0AAV4WM38_9ARAC|nr:hypothetical protein CDAR_548661 [Caerostris darwini]